MLPWHGSVPSENKSWHPFIRSVLTNDNINLMTGLRCTFWQYGIHVECPNRILNVFWNDSQAQQQQQTRMAHFFVLCFDPAHHCLLMLNIRDRIWPFPDHRRRSSHDIIFVPEGSSLSHTTGFSSSQWYYSVLQSNVSNLLIGIWFCCVDSVDPRYKNLWIVYVQAIASGRFISIARYTKLRCPYMWAPWSPILPPIIISLRCSLSSRSWAHFWRLGPHHPCNDNRWERIYPWPWWLVRLAGVFCLLSTLGVTMTGMYRLDGFFLRQSVSSSSLSFHSWVPC